MTTPASYRSRAHGLLLYPDCPEHVKALELLQTSFEHLFILHDKDKDEKTGELKKPHWHVVIKTRNATWSTAICKQLGIESNYCQQIRNESAMVGYLVHWNEENKHQYDFEECKGTEKLKKLLRKITVEEELTEGEKVLELIEWIENCDKPLDIAGFARVCAGTDRWDIFRRSASIFLKIIEEKNKKLKGQLI